MKLTHESVPPSRRLPDWPTMSAWERERVVLQACASGAHAPLPAPKSPWSGRPMPAPPPDKLKMIRRPDGRIARTPGRLVKARIATTKPPLSVHAIWNGRTPT